MDEYGMFNRKLTDMLEDLAECFPSVPEFSMAVSPPARMLLSLDPRQAQRLFQDYVALPYEEYILSRDEVFLLSQDSFGPVDAPCLGDVVALIKRVWQEASDENKDAIWRHLHVLIVLNRRCSASNS